MPGEDGGDMMVFASKGTYLRKGEQFIFGLYIFECFKRNRFKHPEFKHIKSWHFECKIVRQLTKEEFVERKWPLEVKGEAW